MLIWPYVIESLVKIKIVNGAAVIIYSLPFNGTSLS